jgi:hypothetical protein
LLDSCCWWRELVSLTVSVSKFVLQEVKAKCR